MSADAPCFEAEPAAAPCTAAPPRRRVHPLSWVAAAVLLPLIWWDIGQTQHDVRMRREATLQPAAALATGFASGQRAAQRPPGLRPQAPVNTARRESGWTP